MPQKAPGFEPGRLRLARELRGLNQAELADKTGITSAAISPIRIRGHLAEPEDVG